MIADFTDLEVHRPVLTGHCYRMLGSAFDAEDAVQETLIRAWRKRDQFDGRASIESTIVGIGITLLFCTILYVVPRTAVLGAILLTGYLGGAVASNVRAETPTFNAVFPVLVAVVVWTSLVLRDKRLESLLLKAK